MRSETASRLTRKVVEEPAAAAPLALEIARLLALLIVAVLLQTAVAPNIRILGANPDFVLILTVSVGLLRGAEVGAGFGFVAGAVLAVALFEPTGIASFVLVLIGYFAGRYAETADLSHGFAPLVAVLAGSVVAGSLYVLAQFLLARDVPLEFVAGRVMLPTVILNTLLASPVYLFAHWWLRGERRARVSETS